MKRWLLATMVSVGSLLAWGAQAQNCAGFTDVLQSNQFCANIEWIKNRQVTLGCAAGMYCPTAFVPRQEMAAFMNRLGTALTPVILNVNGGLPGSTSITTKQRMCQTATYSPTGFPRTAFAYGSAVLGLNQPGVVFVRAVYSTDGGTTWTSFNQTDPLASAATRPQASPSIFDLASSAVLSVPLDLDPGTSYLFAIELERYTPSVGGDPYVPPTSLWGATCGLRVEVRSRDGTSSPF